MYLRSVCKSRAQQSHRIKHFNKFLRFSFNVVAKLSSCFHLFKAHRAFIGTQTTSQVEMSSLNTTKSTSLPTKTTHGKSTGTTFDSTNFMTTDSTLDTPSQLTSGISPNSFVNTKLSSSPLTSAVTKQWPFVTIPVGKRRRIFRINKFG